ncbi:zinc-binding dehydrogenase [Streptomyces fulvoviolaceus]|uniref:zinc-binding dehydrogenase n=1 Tax=Streptomyces fulvoviolaceus TaxID=285535 RepID=UPI0021BEBBF5|nr:zinc-binding dehydrogenase [Streptomyces fulvoviolaceus]MCT9084224.1 zinc-binding dehydrogenase [Streptomyces fulvoviolaceus]
MVRRRAPDGGGGRPIRATAFKETGGPEVLRLVDLPDPDLHLPVLPVWKNNRTLTGYNIGDLSRRGPDALRRRAVSALALAAAGDVRIDVTEEYALEEAGEAPRVLGEGRNKGKVVLRVAGAQPTCRSGVRGRILPSRSPTHPLGAWLTGAGVHFSPSGVCGRGPFRADSGGLGAAAPRRREG